MMIWSNRATSKLIVYTFFVRGWSQCETRPPAGHHIAVDYLVGAPLNMEREVNLLQVARSNTRSKQQWVQPPRYRTRCVAVGSVSYCHTAQFPFRLFLRIFFISHTLIQQMREISWSLLRHYLERNVEIITLQWVR